MGRCCKLFVFAFTVGLYYFFPDSLAVQFFQWRPIFIYSHATFMRILLSSTLNCYQLDRTPSPYFIVPDRVWKRCVSLSLVPHECVVFCVLNILLYGSEILFNILEKDTVAVYVCALSTPKLCRGFCFLHPKYSSSLLRIQEFEFLVPTFHFFCPLWRSARTERTDNGQRIPNFEDWNRPGCDASSLGG